MPFADLKNDFVFRRIFATHPDILRGLLNDLLERTGEAAIASIEYLPSEQLPLVVGAKLSILDVRCKDQAARPSWSRCSSSTSRGSSTASSTTPARLM